MAQENPESAGRSQIRTLLVDDSPRFLRLAASLLGGQPQVQIVGQVSSGREALKCAEELRPDLVVMDLSMPDMDGLEATRRLKARTAAPRVVILTLYEEEEYRAAAATAGADAFVVKAQVETALLAVVHELFAN